MSDLSKPAAAHPAAAPAEQRPLYYVLSAGRTGTVFLENLVKKHFSDVSIEHEPSPSRYLMMLGNLRNDFGLMHGATRWMSAWHQRRAHSGAKQYIEVNPFLCAVTDLLPQNPQPLRIVHMVRDPGAWAQSMTTFKASTKYRHIIDYVPFAKPFPAPRPAGWAGLSPYEKSLHRWVWCNQRIAALSTQAQSYTLIKSEDIFAGTDAQRDAALARIFEVLDLPAPEGLSAAEFETRVNPSPQGSDLRNTDVEQTICGEVAAQFGYDL